MGFTSCPGRSEELLDVTAHRRLLETDVRVLRNWHAKALVSVLEDEELKTLKAEDVGASATRAGIWWFRIPVKKDTAPDERFHRAWPQAAPALLEMLRQGQRVVLHSDEAKDSRPALVACLLLAELGLSAEAALTAVRHAHPAAADFPAYELFVRTYLPHFPEHTRLRSPPKK